jgi:hypothetical protein
MRYSRNAVFTIVKNEIQLDFPHTYITSRLVAKPAFFPACYIHEIDNNRPVENVQFDYKDVQWESVFEIKVISNKNDTAASEVYAIMESAKAAFNKLYYREFSGTNIDRGDTYTLVGRFRRIIGGGDTIPNT